MMSKRKCSYIVGVILAIILFRILVGEPCHVDSPSMEPTILSGDWLWIDKTTYGGKLPVRFADIPLLNIFTWIPFLRKADEKNNWGNHRFFERRSPMLDDIAVFSSPEDNRVLLVKRVKEILHAGDEIKIDSSNYEVVKSILEKENNTLATHEGSILINGVHDSIYVVQQSYYYMLGDNDSNSHDSRHYGYITEDALVGRISRSIFSIDKDLNKFFKMRTDRFFSIIK